MSEQPPPPNNPNKYREYLYEPTEYLAVGFNNELSSKVVLDPQETKVMRLGVILTPEERFKTAEGLEADPNVAMEMMMYPEKMKAIEKVVGILNRTTDVMEYKRAMNKMTRLLKGMDADLLYYDEKANPSLLVL